MNLHAWQAPACFIAIGLGLAMCFIGGVYRLFTARRTPRAGVWLYRVFSRIGR